MADTTEQTVETSQNGLMDFNWDESGADSFFGLNEFGEEPKPIEEKTPKSVVQTTPPTTTETIEPSKEEVEKARRKVGKLTTGASAAMPLI